MSKHNLIITKHKFRMKMQNTNTITKQTIFQANQQIFKIVFQHNIISAPSHKKKLTQI